MPDIKFNCPHCQNELVVDERGAGKQVKCPKCSGDLTIPALPFLDLSEPTTEPVAELSCPQCSAPLPSPEAGFCMKCGASLSVPQKGICTNCNAKLIPNAGFCMKCGKPVNGAERSPLLAPSQPLKLRRGVQSASAKSMVLGNNKTCLYCGAEYASIAATCPGCGRDLRPGSRVSHEKPTATEASSGLGTSIGKLFKAIGFIFLIIMVISVGSMIWDNTSKKSSNPSSVTQEKQTQAAAVPNVITEEFDKSMLGHLKATPSTLFDDGYMNGQYYQEFNRIKLNISVKNARLCDEKLEQFQHTGASKEMDYYHRTKQFVEGFRAGYFAAPDTEEETQRRAEKIKREYAELAADATTTDQNSPASSGQADVDAAKLSVTGMELVRQGHMSEAAKYFKRAADLGDAMGQNNLGVCYLKGYGVYQDQSEAVRWFLKSANQGFGEAQNNLGVCYRDGTGVSASKMEASKWFHKAAAQGLSGADQALNELRQ